jgi:hypothetical protein
MLAKVPTGVCILIGSTAMASDAEWVEDVRRWYFAGQRSGASTEAETGIDKLDADVLGYEAADPSLQSRNWPDAPSSTEA